MTSTPGCCQVTTTLPDRAAAERLAATLVEERWAACAQVVGPVESTYRWQGEVERATEWYCHLKTTLARAPGLRGRTPRAASLRDARDHRGARSWTAIPTTCAGSRLRWATGRS